MPLQPHQQIDSAAHAVGVRLLAGVLSLMLISAPYASASTGNIDATQKYAWSNKGGWVNFAPTNSGVTVTDTLVTGYAWSANHGWINFSPSSGGVQNDGSGTLSGYAWDSGAGWINFSGVTIDSSGRFNGQASGSDGYAINFDCTACDVVTSWRASTGGGGGETPDVSDPVVPPVDPPPAEPPPAEEPPATLPDGSSDTVPSPSGTDDTSPSGTGGGDGGPTSGGAREAVREVVSVVATYVTQTVVPALSKIASAALSPVAVVGVATGIMPSLAVIVPNVAQGPDLLLSIIRLWDFFLVWLGFKKRKPWGTVYDSVTKQPLDPAYVVLKDASGQESKTSITDLNGRYGFPVAPGTYRIEANKTHYQFPSQRLAGHLGDELYQGLYFGEPLAVGGEGDVITRNIPMDPIGFDWNEFIKKEKKVLRYYSNRARVFGFLSLWLFRIGFVAAAYACFKARTTFDIVVLGLYILVALFRYLGFGPRTYGSLTEKETGIPLPFALVKVRYAQMPDQVLRSSVADKIGRYYALVPNGQYVVDVVQKNDDESYTTVYTSSVLDVKKGIINTNFAV